MSDTFAKRTILSLLIISAFILTAVFLPQTADAEENQQQQQSVYAVNHTSVTFNASYSEPWKALWIVKQDVNPKDFSPITRYSCPADDSIVHLHKESWPNGVTALVVYPLKAGSTNISVTLPDNQQVSIPVTVAGSYFRTALAENSYFSISDQEDEFNNKFLYGEKKYFGSDTVPYAKVTVKCGKTKISTQANAQGKFSFKFKKIYKLKTKGWIKYTSNGVSYTDKLKVSKWSKLTHKQGFTKSKGGKTLIGFNVKNLHKGDVIIVRINGSTYTQKITKAAAKSKKLYVPVAQTAKGTQFRVMLKNKYKQNMVVKTLLL